MTEVIWTRRALRNVNAIRLYVSQFNPLAAQRLALRLFNAGQSLSEFAARGTQIFGGRRQFTTVRPYLIRYRLDGDVATILEIRHAAEDAP